MCLDTPEGGARIYCCKNGHLLCEDDLRNWRASRPGPRTTCPVCRTPIDTDSQVTRLRSMEDLVRDARDGERAGVTADDLRLQIEEMKKEESEKERERQKDLETAQKKLEELKARLV